MGIDPAKMSSAQLRQLANCLQQDVFNINTVARHLRQLIDHDKLQQTRPLLGMEQVRIVGARYNRGISLSLDQIKKNMSYGNFIVNFWPRFSRLLN